MKASDPRHGTYAGAQKHQLDGEIPCGPCKRARADYVASWRAGDRSDWRLQKNARARALNALARLHPQDFHRLYVAERLKDRTPQGTRGAS